jgi:hypothetical protein
LLTSQASRGQGTQPFNLTGAWAADDGAIYYIRHLADNSICWVGLHNSGFHLGVRFTNVFRGIVNPRNRTIEGSWADVPRGGILQHGRLSLDIVEIAPPSPDDNGEPPRPPNGPPGPGGSRERRLELRRRPEGTTGGFGGTIWRRWFIDEPYDITYRFEHVRRYDSQFRDDNTPFKDFAVVFGTITNADPVHLHWGDSRARDYCDFLNENIDDQDGDLTFNVIDPLLDWNTGWIRSSSEIQAHLAHNGNQFHTETVMFGRTNNEDDCRAAPNVLLPGWMETEGNSVLLNGQPVNGHVVRVQIGTPPGQPPVPPTVEFRLIGPNGAPFTVALMVGMRVRVTGVINLDEHAEGPPDFHGAPEIHPVYAIDFLQNFRQPRPGADLTGVWHANDVGTYYLRQVDGKVLWWLGLSRDQGRAFANVFQGTIQNNTITGDWVDVPLGTRGARSSGRLRLIGDGSSQLGATTTLRAVERTGGFGGSVWNKLYDRPPSNR